MLATERLREVHVASLDSPSDMSNARPAPLDRTTATTRRFPKLTLRNRLSLTTSESPQSSEESHNETPQPSLHPEAARTGGSHARQGSSPSLRPDHCHQRQTSKAMDVTEQQQQQHGRHDIKKKSSGVLGFLTLKEPSTSALEEFAEQERRKAAQKNFRSDGVMLPGVSSQKLPDHVPKVNSKWDGLPDSAKRKLDKNGEREKAKRSSVTSFSSSGSGDAPRRSYGSLSSKPVARQSQDRTASTTQAATVSADGRPDTATSKLSSTPSSTTHPALRHTQSQLSNDVRAQALHLPTPTTAFRLDPQDDAFEFELSDIPSLQERDYSSGSATSPEASPRTPAFDAVSPGFDHGASRCQSPTVVVSSSPKGNGGLWTTECEYFIAGRSGVGALSPPSMSGLSAKTSGRSLSAQAGTIMPPIQETVVSPDPAVVCNFSHVSRYHTHSASKVSAVGPAPVAVGVSTVKPTAVVRGQSNPAAAMKGSEKKEVLPWEMFEPPLEVIRPTSETSKLKRFSKLGRK